MLHGLRCPKFVHVSRPSATSTWATRRGLLTLAIESSCDDTCVSILSKRTTYSEPNSTKTRLHFNEKITLPNTGKGGIYPPEALNSHQLNLAKLVEKSLPCLPEGGQALPERKRLSLQDGGLKEKPDFVSVTRGPGMNQNLATGLNTAKGLATAWQIPLVGVHHMQAHALTPRLVNSMEGSSHNSLKPDFPFLTLLVSGGHTMLLYSKGLVEHEVLASTRDVAVGDELDKCGRIILPQDIQQAIPDTAFGKYLSAYAYKTSEDFTSWDVPQTRQEEILRPLNKFGWNMMTPMAKNRDLAFNFSGIASQVSRIMRGRTSSGDGAPMSEEERLLLARAALGTAFEHLGSRTIMALEKLREQEVEISTLVVSGGVAANDFLRYYLRQMLHMRSFGTISLVFPSVELCTDNAAMIAWAGMEMFEAGYRTDLGCGPLKKWSMDRHSEDGGILGVPGWLGTDGQRV
ncbi:Mitochondrial tRNAs modification protein [Exophiala xenobiotica]|nr:Mitochondrial tRNAs modification protein [Exophiala xenobiotica]KAK5231062.1 Mitochondrial tRNAs modification protein [Exophiala xenobiotica]KAK5299576.1 Mitochondrial tRNAs modification protein [Exophiala xenobiotica]KAK5499585.1 Mitochondrial tRNAs modification protein [Exophiala xenobiotica]